MGRCNPVSLCTSTEFSRKKNNILKDGFETLLGMQLTSKQQADSLDLLNIMYAIYSVPM